MRGYTSGGTEFHKGTAAASLGGPFCVPYQVDPREDEMKVHVTGMVNRNYWETLVMGHAGVIYNWKTGEVLFEVRDERIQADHSGNTGVLIREVLGGEHKFQLGVSTSGGMRLWGEGMLLDNRWAEDRSTLVVVPCGAEVLWRDSFGAIDRIWRDSMLGVDVLRLDRDGRLVFVWEDRIYEVQSDNHGVVKETSYPEPIGRVLLRTAAGKDDWEYHSPDCIWRGGDR